ncbi:leucine-rich repeat-containing protein 37A3-like [Heterocephalus glaber]|uniref:Leucine-rich repeat-containing protein 37A3-like n=1 Tax=Heterocephalus glaber TaxID=10181 RepID=A0AAX6SGG5_HETGA|nr:leucine-rich repeat-containing protein 37A3-like [Heterocephalus glaber]
MLSPPCEFAGQLSPELDKVALVPALGDSAACRSYHNLSNVTVRPADMELAVTSEPTGEVKSSPAQQKAPAQLPGSPEETESSPQEQKQPVQHSEAPEEVEPSGSQLEAPPQIENPLEEFKPSVQEDAQASEALLESTGKIPLLQQVTLSLQSFPGKTNLGSRKTLQLQCSLRRVWIKSQFQLRSPSSQVLTLPKVTVTPSDLQLTRTPAPTAEVGTSLTHHEATAQPSVPLDNVEPPVMQKEAPSLPPDPSEGVEPLHFQQEAPAPSSEPVQAEQTSPASRRPQMGPRLLRRVNLLKPSRRPHLYIPQEATAQPPELPNITREL